MDLADHRSGLPRASGDATPYATSNELMESLDHCAGWSDPCIAPGSGLYSNYAYQVLGNIISDYLQYPTWSAMNSDLLTGPLGMAKTCLHGDGCNPSFNVNHADPFSFGGAKLPVNWANQVTAPAGSLWSTADDMAIWLRYNLGEPVPPGAQWLVPVREHELLTTGPGSTGFAWSFKNLAFSDGSKSKVRWKNGRIQGLVSYLGVADSRDTAVFVFVNRDPVSSSDPDDERPGMVVSRELGEAVLEQFP